jgi:hypothetical protein
MTDELRYADVVAGVSAAIAAYTQALDDGRTDDVVATFCADGGCDIPGLGTAQGHDALRAAYDAVKPQVPQRHLIVNTLVADWSQTEATASSDVVFLIRGDKGWSVFLAGRYADRLRIDAGTWKFVHRSAEFTT